VGRSGTIEKMRPACEHSCATSPSKGRCWPVSTGRSRLRPLATCRHAAVSGVRTSDRLRLPVTVKLLRSGVIGAIVLLLVRLGLRAGDGCHTCVLDDVEWETGPLRVSAKSRYEVASLPQDVGDANCGLPRVPTSVSPSVHVFLPLRLRHAGHSGRVTASRLVKRVMRRAASSRRIKGAHALRHTAATEIAAAGVPLGEIGIGPPASRHRHDKPTTRRPMSRSEADRTALAGDA